MKNKFIIPYLSNARLQNYNNLFSGNYEKAISLYKANIRLSQSFYPLLAVLEITLRNALDTFLQAHFSDPNWLVNQKTGFMSDRRLTHYNQSKQKNVTNDFLKRSVQKVEDDLGVTATHDYIVSKLHFSFWTTFFEPTHYKILSGSTIKIFPHLPHTIKRSDIYKKLDEIREFRNKIYHNETICFYNKSFDISSVTKIYITIYEVLNWFSPDFEELLKDIDFVNYEFKRIILISQNNNSAKYYLNRFKLKIIFLFRKLFSS